MLIRQAFIFALQIALFHLATTKASNHQLIAGSSISVKDASISSGGVLISPDNTFTCGFYGSGANNAYWLAIWFTNSKDKTVVWTANREQPVNGHGSKLTLRGDGALVLTDLDGSVTWKTSTTSTDVVVAELRNSGNLVLKGSAGDILWQSFDYPTDTLLPNQPFTKSTRLVSRIPSQRFASGYYSFFFDSDNVLKMIYNGPDISSIYWPDLSKSIFDNGRINYNSSRMAVLDSNGTFTSSDWLRFDASDIGITVKRRLTMDSDGNLRLYSLNESSGSWDVTWEAISRLCHVHGLCGINGICVYTPQTYCSCPPHYEGADLSDWSKGCMPSFNMSYTKNDSFVEMRHVECYGFDLNYTTKTSFEGCRALCLGDYRCHAFSYRLTGGAICFTKCSLFNGCRASDNPYITYLRVPKLVQAKALELVAPKVSQLVCKGRENTKHDTYGSFKWYKWVFPYSFTTSIGIIEIIIFAVGWFFLVRKPSISKLLEDGYEALACQFINFGYSELKMASENFKEVLGRGGFGIVYKGVLVDERVVAIKKLEDAIQGEQEFWAEVSIIGKINHLNLARMWGFCSEGKNRLLVYEYIENGSMDKHLFSTTNDNNTQVLGWKERFKISLGMAKGLSYLHHECLEWVIHCDVKPENILLDIDFEPKISYFGLVKLRQRGGNASSKLTRIRGTTGYMAPESITNLPLTAKVDVYSYGVVILELVRGIRMSDIAQGKDEEITELASLVRLVSAKIIDRDQDPSWMEDLVDQRLEGQFSRKQVNVMIQVGISCVNDDRNKRPTMESVAQLLADYEDETANVTQD